ncbi:MAG: VOC family protein [Pseudomonadota bacterium]
MPVTLSVPAIQIGLVTNDYPPMKRFYGSILGLPEDVPASLPGLTTYKFRCGDSVIKIVELEMEVEQSIPVDNPQSIFRTTGYRYLTLPVKNLDEVVADCIAAGVTVLKPKTEVLAGVFVCLLLDPDGNCVELKQETQQG